MKKLQLPRLILAMNNFARTLQKLIEEFKISQSEIEKRSGINQASISRYKNGLEYPKITALPNLLSAFPVKKDQCELFANWLKDQLPHQIKNDIKIKTPFEFESDNQYFDFPDDHTLTPEEKANLEFVIDQYMISEEIRALVDALVNLLSANEQLKVAEEADSYSKKKK